jgi:hypothetical protein
MDLAALIVSFGLLVVSGVAAAAAVVQARAAGTARDEADAAVREARDARDESARLAAVATSAFVRQAAAQERANALKEEEMRPPAWSGPKRVSGSLYRLINSSGRTIHVEEYEVLPVAAENLIQLRGPEDGMYAYGDALSWVVNNRMGLSVEKLTLVWRYADEPDGELNYFIIPM